MSNYGSCLFDETAGCFPSFLPSILPSFYQLLIIFIGLYWLFNRSTCGERHARRSIFTLVTNCQIYYVWSQTSPHDPFLRITITK